MQTLLKFKSRAAAKRPQAKPARIDVLRARLSRVRIGAPAPGRLNRQNIPRDPSAKLGDHLGGKRRNDRGDPPDPTSPELNLSKIRDRCAHSLSLLSRIL